LNGSWPTWPAMIDTADHTGATPIAVATVTCCPEAERVPPNALNSQFAGRANPEVAAERCSAPATSRSRKPTGP
jgi:hypothetical protein